MTILTPGDKAEFLNAFDTILGWRKYHFHMSCMSPVCENIHPCLRIAVITEGQAIYRISTRTEIIEEKVGKGDLLPVLPYGEFNHWPTRKNGRYRMFTCILHDGLIRLLDYDTRQCVWYHTNRAISQEGWNCAKALEHLSRRNRGEEQSRLITEALLHIARNDLQHDRPNEIKGSRNTYREICSYILEHFQEPINRDSIATAMQVTPQYISKLFKIYHSCGLNQYVKSLRLNRAENLLTNSMLAIKTIALQSGFSSTGYFVKEFKKAFHISPGAYRRTNDGHLAPIA